MCHMYVCMNNCGCRRGVKVNTIFVLKNNESKNNLAELFVLVVPNSCNSVILIGVVAFVTFSKMLMLFFCSL